jgi:spore maturation protein CgeB
MEQELPLPAKEGKHYVTYNDIDDLVDKVRYYSRHDEERIEIAKNGRRMFGEFYDSTKHGGYIRNQIEQVV